ncbi:fimbrial protein pilin [Caballeronia peredens]|nr:fimbrial protein pilin [Caballeronia peredens]
MQVRRLSNIKASASKGFTLIELMITVAIVGILAAVALPAYQDYTIRGQVSEGFVLSGGVQTAVAEYYAQNGSFPATLTTVGLSDPVGKYVSDIAEAGTASQGVITITYGGASNTKIAAKTVTLTASDPGTGVVQWKCAPVSLAQKYVPSSCN